MTRAVLIIILCASTSVADAQIQCGPRDIVMSNLFDRYGEIPIGMGTRDTGRRQILALATANPVTGTWSWVEIHPSGWACLVGSGDNWGPAEQALGDES